MMWKGQILKIPISYQNLAYFQYYCTKNRISIIKIGYEQEPYCIIKVTLEEKDKILHEIEEKQFDIQKMEILQEQYITKNIDEKY